ncbi:pantoate--beta-alanine ligase [Ignatzschineria larvae DSM 13226]|uniref:Pantothenate synthetase n=1 Tax=Ignatzschineria larvae DSM 13226 TaxID=1111732 RepID=A0ABZ3C2C7_9GAMM|nr:pantoate--beta-alanine ligase [Ignatzschineria larvae]
MEILRSIEAVREWRQKQATVAFVPTMGNLHAGHISLVQEAKKHSENVIVSIFVNPLQFGPGEDLESYPRTLAEDQAKLEAEGVSALFLPTESMLYDDEPFLVVPPKSLIQDLCGKSRPGHFEGVATVVSKFFNIVEPTYACFGRKDYQQLKVIEAMVKALNFNIQIIPVAIEREASGLALSSRNGYLTEAEKREAVKLSQTLQTMAQEIKETAQADRISGIYYRDLEKRMSAKLNGAGFEVDYLTIRTQDRLEEAQENDRELVILAAAKLGKPRLLDNLEVSLP